MNGYILFAIPFFLTMVGLEIFYSRKKNKHFYRLNDTVSNLAIGIGYETTGLFLKLIIFGAYIYFYESWSFLKIPATWWSFILVLLLYDFCFYWAHRMLHVVNIFWGAHVVHHSSEEYNLSVALRQSWFESFLAFFIFLPIPLLGFDPIVFIPAAAFDSLYQFWIHTQAVNKMPVWFEKIMNTPSHHRVHHARNPKYIDKNYAGIFIFWDKLFGSFQEEEETPVFGITTPLNSWNPVWANVHYFQILLKKMKLIRSPFNKFKLLFSKPGWMPEENGGIARPPEIYTNTIIKYDAKTSGWMNIYAIVQIGCIIGGLMAYMFYFEALNDFYKYSIGGIIMLAIMICCGMLERKNWVIPLEYVKLTLLLLTLNSYYYLYELEWFISALLISTVLFILFNIWFTYSWKYRWEKQMN